MPLQTLGAVGVGGSILDDAQAGNNDTQANMERLRDNFWDCGTEAPIAGVSSISATQLAKQVYIYNFLVAQAAGGNQAELARNAIEAAILANAAGQVNVITQMLGVSAAAAQMTNSLTAPVGGAVLTAEALSRLAAIASIRADLGAVTAVISHPSFNAAVEGALVTGALGGVGEVSVDNMRTAIQNATDINAAGLEVLAGLNDITDHPTTVAKILQKPSLTAAIVAALTLATVRGAIGNDTVQAIHEITGDRLAIIGSEATIRGDGPAVLAVVSHPNFDADAVAGLVTGALGAGGEVTVLDMQDAVQAGGNINPAGLEVLAGLAGIGDHQATVVEILQKTTLTTAVVGALTVATVAAAIAATAGIISERLITIGSTDTVRANAAAVAAVVAHGNFTIDVAQALAGSAAGLASIAGLGALAVGKLQILADAALVRANAVAVAAIVDQAAFDASVADRLAQDAAGLAIIQGLPVGLAAAKLAILVVAPNVIASQATIDALITKDNFNAAVATALAGAAGGLAAIQALPADLAAAKLAILVAEAQVIGNQATINALIAKDNFNAVVAEALAAAGGGLAAIVGALAGQLAVAKLQALAGSATVRGAGGDAAVAAIIAQTAFDVTVTDILAQDADGLARINAALGAVQLTAAKLQILAASAFVRASDATVAAIIAQNAFSATVAQALAQDAVGIAAINAALGAPLAVTKLQALAGAANLRAAAGQVAVEAIVAQNAFDITVARALAQDAAGVARISALDANLAEPKLVIFSGVNNVRTNPTLINYMLRANNLSNAVFQNLMVESAALANGITMSGLGLGLAKTRAILAYPAVLQDSLAAAAVVYAIANNPVITNAEDALLTAAVTACEKHMTILQLRGIQSHFADLGICAGLQAHITAALSAGVGLISTDSKVNAVAKAAVATVPAAVRAQIENTSGQRDEVVLNVVGRSFTPAYNGGAVRVASKAEIAAAEQLSSEQFSIIGQHLRKCM